jgi:flagellum-specific peptidoglycan hydrolase FlgJ
MRKYTISKAALSLLTIALMLWASFSYSIHPTAVEEVAVAIVSVSTTTFEPKPVAPTEIPTPPWNPPHIPTRREGFNKAEQIAFAKAVYEIAKHYEESTGTSAIVVTAQACYESGWGSSYAARERNNIFGITSGKRAFDTMATDELDLETPRSKSKDCFSYYYVLMQGSGYDHAKETGEIGDWIQAFQDTGYHQAGSRYAKIMREIINILEEWEVTACTT